MSTLVKLRGLERGSNEVVSPAGGFSPLSGGNRGFRVKSGYGVSSPAGAAATATGGTSTNGLVVTAKEGGTWANNHTFTYAAGGANSTITIAVTFGAGTGIPTFTFTAGTNATVAQIAAALNANEQFAQLYVATLVSTGAGTSPVSPGALGSGTDVTSTLYNADNPLYVWVNDKVTSVVDVDDPITARTLRRNYNRFISLGAV